LSLAGKRTARFLLAGACVNSSSRHFVACVACVALAGNPTWLWHNVWQNIQ